MFSQTEKMKIVFNPREKIPTQNEDKFSKDIRVAVRTCVELKGISMWRQIPKINKEECRRILLVSHRFHFLFRKKLLYNYL